MNVIWLDVILWVVALISAGLVYILISKGHDVMAAVIGATFLVLFFGLLPAQMTTEKPKESFEVFKDHDVESVPERIYLEKQDFSEKIDKDIQEARNENFNQ